MNIRHLRGPGTFHEHAGAFDENLSNEYTRGYQERLEDNADRLQDAEIPAWGSAVVRRALRRIPKTDAAILRLYYVEHKTQQQIGAILGSGQGNISRRIQTAIKRLYVAANHKPLKHCKIMKIR